MFLFSPVQDQDEQVQGHDRRVVEHLEEVALLIWHLPGMISSFKMCCATFTLGKPNLQRGLHPL